MTAATDERRAVHLTRRLSVLPAVVGLLGVIWALVGAWAAGVTDGGSGGAIAVVAAALVGATVVSGSGVGLYTGLTLLIIATLAGGDGIIEQRELAALGLALVIVHETVRFSLDARRPARLGPGLVGGFLARTATVAVLATILMLGLDRLADGPFESPAWVPIGLAATGLPVLILSASARLSVDDRHRPLIRLIPAVAIAVVVLGLAVAGATARSGIETGGSSDDETAAPPPSTTVPADEPSDVVEGPTEFRRGLTLVFLIAATLILGALYLALRRPEAIFDLDDLDYDEDDNSFGFAPPRRADTESTVEVDDGELARLLADLRFDIEAERDPGRAVRFAYANVERRLASLDLPKRPDETEREYLARALAVLDGGRALTELTELFEHARFGADRTDETMRRRALEAIDELERALPQPIDGLTTETSSVDDPEEPR